MFEYRAVRTDSHASFRRVNASSDEHHVLVRGADRWRDVQCRHEALRDVHKSRILLPLFKRQAARRRAYP